ncbi:glycosyltransferase family 1 protein [Halegenticoccus tardaugens]|uniref:glycosyltransferase family 1 protein n=1 Tax=Halegenticoccus tardaugens TaxID=2071624 RepID=UPI001E4DD59B|nr:glycosyltransferase [Halegenticoccus tardaugens]
MAVQEGIGVTERLDVGFVPAECPGAAGTGAVRTSTLLVERLSHHHDLTVYVSSQMDAADADLPAKDRVEYVLHDDLPKLPHPIVAKHRALRGELDAMERHDLVHSYSSAFVPVLAELDVPTLSTLNSYVPVCPKGDMMYHGKCKCTGPSPAKCAGCVTATGLTRRQGLERELRSAYSSLGKIDLVRKSMAYADQIDAYHALSPHMKADYDALGFPGDRITVIPHFYDEAFRRTFERSVGVSGSVDVDGPTGAGDGAGRDGSDRRDDGPFTLLYVGALQDIKGVHVLVRALPHIVKRGHDVRLQVAGAGPYGDRLRRLAREVGADEHVEWLGYVNHGNLPEIYGSADAFVYPGLIDEPFGRVVLEALSTRTPILVSDVGSMDYIVGGAGELFAAGDERALADAFDQLVADYKAYLDAVPAQLENFAPETVIGKFSELYRRVALGGVGARQAASTR